ncbi:stage II sporulation protein R [uncultured Eubacterium sp.]|uniref:stage II sporulation protein R n=1 Tax=uncultured Eubacterium sp. TaxID=165185 RepID=UPI00258C6DE5|nr:stage II sporulation protein R [uncultured Eubacterium sp.]
MSKKIYLFVPIFLIALVLFSIMSPINTLSNDISQKVLRLHILANSDSKADQNLKMMVKDNILKDTAYIFKGCNTLDESIEAANKNINIFQKSAEKTLKNCNSNYSVKVYVDKEFFDIREYKDFTLPSGYYNTIKVVIGEGKGHNWWCVMYPTVCISACTNDFDKVLTKEEKQLITSKKYIPKFKALEIINKLKNKIKS